MIGKRSLEQSSAKFAMNDIKQLGSTKTEVISASWERCEQKFDLIASLQRPIMRMQMNEIDQRREALLEKLGDARAIIGRMTDIATQSGKCMVVADTDKIILELSGPLTGEPEFEERGIALGSIWNEGSAGTNGVAMALDIEAAFIVRGNEHYFDSLKHFSCSAVPILDASDEIIAAISLSSVEQGDRAEYLITQEFLIDNADKIQRELFQEKYKKFNVLRVRHRKLRERNRQNAIIAVNDDFKIVAATKQAEAVSSAFGGQPLTELSLEEAFHPSTHELIPNQLVETNNYFMPSTVNQTGIHVGKAIARRPTRRRLDSALRALALGSDKLYAEIDRAQKFFDAGIPLLISGESGTGKTRLATTLFDSATQNISYTHLECANLDRMVSKLRQLTTELQENGDRHFSQPQGLIIARADELDAKDQIKLISILDNHWEQAKNQNKQYQIISTCREDSLSQLRPELRYRLGESYVILPPLRDRDHPRTTLLEIIKQVAPYDIPLAPDALECLLKYAWRGNLREMISTIRQAILCGNGTTIHLADLPKHIVGPSALEHEKKRTNLRRKIDKKKEEADIRNMLESTNWNVSKAARQIGIGRATIHRKIKEYAISRLH